jgi:hypothetical protein
MLEIRIETHVDLHVKCRLFLPDFNKKWECLVDF